LGHIEARAASCGTEFRVNTVRIPPGATGNTPGLQVFQKAPASIRHEGLIDLGFSPAVQPFQNHKVLERLNIVFQPETDILLPFLRVPIPQECDKLERPWR
jgi:hypothetical protein